MPSKANRLCHRVSELTTRFRERFVFELDRPKMTLSGDTFILMVELRGLVSGVGVVRVFHMISAVGIHYN